MKRDGFGIEHRSTCRGPAWTSVRAYAGRATQRCRYCGVTWSPGDSSTPAQPRVGYPTKKRNKK